MIQVGIAVLLAAAVTGALLPLLRKIVGDSPVDVGLLAVLAGFLVGAGSPAVGRDVGFLGEVEIGLLVPLAIAVGFALWAETREESGGRLFAGMFVAGLVGWGAGWGWGGMALPGGVVELQFLSVPFSGLAVVLGAAAFRAAGPLDGITGGFAAVAALALACLTFPGFDEPPATHAAALAGGVLALLGWHLWTGRPVGDDTAGSAAVGALLALLATRCAANATGETNPLPLLFVFALPAVALAVNRLRDEGEPGIVRAITGRGVSAERALGALMAAAVVLGAIGVSVGKALPGVAREVTPEETTRPVLSPTPSPTETDPS